MDNVLQNLLLLNDSGGNGQSAVFGFGTVVQFLDGSINGSEFVDKSGNGYNADIINNDIAVGTIGFPYKSSALIAQKAANFGIIPDPTNFWYTTGGVPNQIPVVSFFQSVDYANTTFSRHQAQVLAPDGTELTQPSVMEIVTYSTALTGSGLSSANTYFSVPTEVTSNVIWVDWVNGNDTTGTGTKLLPWKTLTKANTGTANKTIYCKTGAYADTASIFFAGGQTWYFIGYSPCTNTATPAFSTSASTGNYIQGVIVTPAAGGRSLYFISGNNNTAYRCKLNVNGSSSKNFQMLAGTGNMLKYCILINTTDTPSVDVRAVGIDIYGCNFSGTQSGVSEIVSFNTTAISGNVNVSYNRFRSGLVSSHGLFNFGVAGNYYIKYNDIRTSGGAQLQNVLAGSGMTGIIEYSYNTIIPTNLSSSVILGTSATNVINYTVKNNTIIIDNTNTLPNGVITIIGQPPPIINYNYIDLNIFANIVSINATSAKGAADISYNTMITRVDGGHIVLGSDVNNTYDNCYNGSTIIGNKLYGLWYFNPSAATNLSHGIAVFNCIDVKVKYNYVNGANHLVVYKASDRVTAMPNTDAVCSYNIGINNEGSLFAKTMSGIKFYNNTTYCDNANTSIISGGVYLLGSTGPANNTIVKNNIFIDATPFLSTKSLFRIDPASTTGTVSDNNVFYSVNNNAIGKITNPGTVTYSSLVAWQGFGQDANSIYQNVSFSSIANEQWWPVPAIQNAAILGAGYDIGLNIQTTFITQVGGFPVITTLAQPTTWQNGAYIQ